jgi:hypothetical protein
LPDGEIKDKFKEIIDTYESKAKDLQKVFIIMLGLGLFFFLMILFPYFSLKYDSNTNSKIEWLTGDISQIVTSADTVINESQTISNNLQTYSNAKAKSDLDLMNYGEQLNRIVFLRNNLSMTVEDPALQNSLQNIEIFPRCLKYRFVDASWQKCNYDSKLDALQIPLSDLFNNTNGLINVSKHRIDSTTRNATNLIKEINGQITGFRSNYATIAQNYDIISKNALSVFENVTNNLKSVRPSVFFFAPQFDLVRLKQLRSDLLQLRSSIESRQSEISNSIEKLSNRLGQFESPLGKVPLGFNETIAVFPLLIAIGIFIFSFLLRQVMCIRIQLKRNYGMGDPRRLTKSDRYVSFLGPLWVDPTNLKQRRERLLLAILFIPFISLFVASLVLVICVSLWLDNPNTTSDDLFPAATNVNNITLIILNILGAGLVMYSCIKMTLFAWKPFNNCS